MDIIFPDGVRACVAMQTNTDVSLYTDMPEVYYLDQYLRFLQPGIALDLGCGVGRASVYLFKRYDWKKTKFYLADGDTCKQRYKGMRDQPGEYYNTATATMDFCRANKLIDFSYINLERQPLASIDEPIDLVYSFLAIGFHWPLSFYLDTLHPLCRRGALLMFGIRNDGEWIKKQRDAINEKLYAVKVLTLCPRETRESVLVLEVL